MFDDWQNEWNRLNPGFVQDGDDLVQVFAHAAKETWYGYFAPLRLLLWTLRTSLKSFRI